MMNISNDIRNLTGTILVSTPSLSDEYLHKTMVFVCSHDKDGAMGVIINKLIPNMNLKAIFKNLGIDSSAIGNVETHFGGLEEVGRCFILHSDDYTSTVSTTITKNIAMTINSDIIRAVTSPGGPKKKIFCMGCCIWDTEQLENEVAASNWVPIEPDEALIFGNPRADKWSKALLKIGTNTSVFSHFHGTA